MRTSEMLLKITKITGGENSVTTTLDIHKLAQVLASMDERLAKID